MLDPEAPGGSCQDPPLPLDAAGVIVRVKEDPAALLSDEVIAWASTLVEINFARLRAQLAPLARKLRLSDFASAVKAARRAREEAEREEDDGAPRTWRDRLRRDRITGLPRASVFNLKIILEKTYAERLSFDEMSAIPMLDERPFQDDDITQLRCDLEETENIEFSRADASDAILLVAKKNSFHPVRRYLRSLKWDGVKRIEKVALEYFGAKDPLSARLITLFFTAAVARAEDPGCKMDNALVLFGDEGFKKSTFFRVLGGAWFKDSKVDITDRKGMMLMHSAWIYEWPEVDRMLEKKHDSDVKAFVTQQDDSYVPMYGRSVSTFLRSSLAVGTTNKEKFITSDTGSRRWWVVTVTKVIDATRLRNERDQLWAEAMATYDEFRRLQSEGVADDENPNRWWLSQVDDTKRAERNEEHLTPSPDVEAVDMWLRGEPICCAACNGSGNGFGFDPGGNANPCSVCQGKKKIVRGELPSDPVTGRTYVKQVDILNGPLGVPLERHHANAGRVSSVLRRLGWRSGKRIQPGGRDGARVTPYYSPELNPDAEEIETGIRETEPPS